MKITINDFFKKIRIKIKQEQQCVSLKDGGEIRLGYDCPIIFLDGNNHSNWNWKLTSENLGLSKKDAMNIVKASDKIGIYNKNLRRRFLALRNVKF